MATVYRYKVECCSPFCAYPNEKIQDIIKKALREFVDKDTGLTLESIVVKDEGNDD
jgi:hypothetical protein